MGFFLLLAIVGFVASVVVHASTFLAAPPMGMDQAWPLHIGIFVVFLPMVIGQKGSAAATAAPATGGEDGGGKRGAKPGERQFGHAPRWMRIGLGVFFAYAFLNFGLMMFQETGRVEGRVRVRDGRPVVEQGGRVVRTLSDAEYRRHGAGVARGFSGHWMLFYWASVVGLYDGLRRRRAAAGARVGPPGLPASVRYTNRYERAPAARMSPWLHATVGTTLSLVGFFAVPLGVVSAVFALGARGGGWGWFCVIAPLFFGGALVGLAFPRTLMGRYVAAACPACGGRAYAEAGSVDLDGGGRYRCRECGGRCGVDGVVVAEAGGK